MWRTGMGGLGAYRDGWFGVASLGRRVDVGAPLLPRVTPQAGGGAGDSPAPPPLVMKRELRALPPHCRGADSACHGSEYQHIAGESTGLGKLRCGRGSTGLGDLRCGRGRSRGRDRRRCRRGRSRGCDRRRCRRGGSRGCDCRRRGRRTWLEGQSRHVGMRLAGRVLQVVLHERSFIPPGRRADRGGPPSGAQTHVRRRASR